jgi:tetratricopeptide (TPR) repeat protein
VVLDKLSPDETMRLICQSLAVDRLPDEVRDLILERAEGHPFFSEELALSLRDSGIIVVDDGASRLAAPDRSLRGLVVPDTVQGVILSRIDHLEARQQLLLKVGSIFGRSFQLDQVRDVFPAEGEHDHIAEDLRALIERGLLTFAGDASFAFRHAMTQDVVYESMVYAQRRLLHGAAAIWLEDHPEDLERGDAVLAHHWLQAAGDARVDVAALHKAAFYLARAGSAALRQGAFVEAEDFLSQALACHARIPVSDRSRTDELEILRHLGTATFAIRGFGSPESRRIYERTFELARGRVTDRELFPILWGLWITTHFASAERAIELGEELMDIAEREDDDEFRLQAHHALWTTLIQIPDYDRARRHLDAGVRLYRPEWHERHCADFGGHDPGSCAERAIALTAWTTGLVDEAVVAGSEAIELAQDHDFSRLNAMLALAFVHRQRGDLDAVVDAVEAIIALGRDRGLLGYVEWANILGAWVRGRRGDLGGGLSMMEAAADRLGMTDPGYMAMLAELYLFDGRTQAGLGLVDELLAVVERKGERSYEPELHRLRGELLVRDNPEAGVPDDAAETSLRRALELADAQGALSFSLRASLSMARLLSSTERSTEGVALLRATYDRFSEGLDTRDLVDSREFLERHQ